MSDHERTFRVPPIRALDTLIKAIRETTGRTPVTGVRSARRGGELVTVEVAIPFTGIQIDLPREVLADLTAAELVVPLMLAAANRRLAVQLVALAARLNDLAEEWDPWKIPPIDREPGR